MNTRLQVEHPVTEMITGIDLVNEQIRVAAAARSACSRATCASTATPSNAASMPRTRDLHALARQDHLFPPPGGLGVRVDSGRLPGYSIPPNYDSLIGKLIVHGRNRVECMMRLKRCLDEFVVDGINTTIPLFRRLVEDPEIADGMYDIHWLEGFSPRDGE